MQCNQKPQRLTVLLVPAFLPLAARVTSADPPLGSADPLLGSAAWLLGFAGPLLGSAGPMLGYAGPLLGSTDPLLASVANDPVVLAAPIQFMLTPASTRIIELHGQAGK